MNDHHADKITAGHLKRDAYLYIRQSTIRQVFENTESTRRQYALRQRAVALGWPVERVIVIDSDLGKSGAGGAVVASSATITIERNIDQSIGARVDAVWKRAGV